MKTKLFAIVLIFFSQGTFAAGFHYCTGKITKIVTRSVDAGTQVGIEGMTGLAKIGYGGEVYSKLHNRQFSMLLSAQLAGKEVRLEFSDNSMNCTDDHDLVLIRYVNIDS